MADSKHKVSSGLPVADSVAGCRMPIQNIKLAVGCRLPIQLPVADSVADSIQTTQGYRQVQRIGNWQLVAGCRFRFETDNISSANRQLATCCRLPIQMPIQYRQVELIGNWKLGAGSRFRFEKDNRSSTNRQAATSCRLLIQLPTRNR